jgi:hypothetical protein
VCAWSFQVADRQLPGRYSIAWWSSNWHEGDVPDLPSSLDATSLETSRLLLRRWRSEDLDGFAAVNAQPEAMRYIHDGRTLDRAATAEAVGHRPGSSGISSCGTGEYRGEVDLKGRRVRPDRRAAAPRR